MTEEPEKKRTADALRDWGIDVEVFESRAKESVGAAKGELGEALRALRESLLRARDRVSAAGTTAKPAAGELKNAFEKAWQDLEEGFLRAGEKIREARAAREKEEPPDDHPPTQG